MVLNGWVHGRRNLGGIYFVDLRDRAGLAQVVLPGDDSMGLVPTILVGIVGALVGWVLFAFLLGIGDSDKFDLGSIVGAIIGTMLVLLVLRAVRGSGSGTPATRRT